LLCHNLQGKSVITLKENGQTCLPLPAGRDRQEGIFNKKKAIFQTILTGVFVGQTRISGLEVN